MICFLNLQNFGLAKCMFMNEKLYCNVCELDRILMTGMALGRHHEIDLLQVEGSP